MATDVLATMQGYVDALTAGGVRATLEPRDINPPAVIIRPPTLHYRFGRGCIGADWTARLYLPDPGTFEALKIATQQLDAIQQALGFAVVDAVPGDFTLMDGATVPGYTLTWTTH
jgi:hypothetical protein